MTSIPCRRILATGALAARPCLLLRASAPKAKAAAIGSSLRVAAAAHHRPSYSTTTRMAPPQLRWSRLINALVRGSATSATESKIWTFEEIQSLSSSPPTQTPTKPRPILIDVREPEELAATGRIPGSQNVPVNSAPDGFHLSPEEFEDRFGFARPGAGDEVVFYCRAGVRSRAAAGLAHEARWDARVGEYPGSWMEWVAKGGDVEW